MRILAVSDLHGDLDPVWSALSAARPDLLLCCGDWGDPGEITREQLQAFTDELPVHTVYGNHDDLDLLRAWENRDGTPVLLPPDSVTIVNGLRLAGISGIWAKSHRQPFYVTDEDVAGWTGELLQACPVDILLSHACPQGVADLTISGPHGGQRCFLDAFRALQPRVYLTGHLHRAQQHVTRTGQLVRNIGATPQEDATMITVEFSADGLPALFQVEPFEASA